MVTDSRRKYLDDYVESRKRINISLCLSDFEKITYLAELNESKPTSYVSEIIQKHLIKSPHVSKHILDEIQEMKFLLRNVATNINQIAHHSNTMKILVNERELLLELKKLEDGISDYIYKEVDK